MRRAGASALDGVGAGEGVAQAPTDAVELTPEAAAAAPARADAASAETLPVFPSTPSQDMPGSATYAVTRVV